MDKTNLSESSGFLWVEQGEQKIGPVAEVAPILKLDRTYTFAVPPELSDHLSIGRRVMVPLRKSGRLATGFVVGLDQKRWDRTLRPIHTVLDAASFLTPELIVLGREISAHYCCPLGQTLKAMTPQSVRLGRGLHRLRYVRLAGEKSLASENAPRMTAKRRAVLDQVRLFPAGMSVNDLRKQTQATSAIVRALVKAGLLEQTFRECLDEEFTFPSPGAIQSPVSN